MSDASNDTLPASGHLGRVIGKFRLERRLGSGAMGDVFLGVHTALGNFVAIKILNATATAESTGVERFLNEARAVAAIGHENIASVIDQDRLADGTPYIVMEYVEGTTLRDLLVERKALPLRFAAELAIDTLAALSAAHRKGIVHRDLKPENIRVTLSQRAKVLDFGVAKLLQSPSTQLSTDGALIGTPHYMAPEQIAAGPIDGRADLYAVGVLLFECTTGRRPFEGRTLMELLQQQLHAAPPWPHQLRPDLTTPLEEVILKALEKDPARRFQSADEMAAALRALLPALTKGNAPVMETGGADVTATPGGSVYTPTRKERPVAEPGLEAKTERSGPRWRGLQLAAVFAGLAALSAAVVLVVQTQQQGVVEIVPRRDTPRVAVAPPVKEAPRRVAENLAPGSQEATVTPPQVATPVPPAKPGGGQKPVTAAVQTKVPPAPAAAGPDAVKPATGGSAVFINTSAQLENLPADYDAKHFDVFGYVKRARALAAERMSDAVLINVDADGVLADGHADLTLSRDYEARYWFRSPSRSVVNPALPTRDQDIVCKVYITATAKGVERHLASSSDGCTDKPLPAWRCTMPQAMQKGAMLGARTDRAAKVTFLTDGTWMIDQGDGPNETVFFSCP